MAVRDQDIAALLGKVGAQVGLYEPLPALAAFHASRASYRWVLGGNRSGKSHGCIGYDMCAFALGIHEYRPTPKNAVIWACTDTWDMVGKILWQEKVKDFIRPQHINALRWHNRGDEIPKQIDLNNGNVIEFKAFQQGRELFQGRAVDAIYQDEQCKYASQVIFQELQARLLDKHGFYAASLTPIISQPWLERRLATPGSANAIFHADLNDNRLSQGGYTNDEDIDALIADWPEEVQPTRVQGLWGSFYGAVFKAWRNDIHTCKPFAIPDDWRKYRAIDFGYNNPFVCLWAARDPDDCWYVYDEHYRAKDTLASHHKSIGNRSNGDRYTATYADHDAQDRRELRDLGLYTTAAAKDVRLGIECVQRALKVQANGKPRLKVFETCTHTISEMASYHYPEGTDQRDPKDEPVKVNDHTVDALRYMLYSADKLGPGFYAGKKAG